MGILDTILGREQRAVTARSSDPYLAEFFGQRRGIGGYVNPDTASGHAVAHRCISVIAENLAALPLKVYRRTDNGGRDVAAEVPLYGVLHDQLNASTTAFEGREWLAACALTHGNAYARIERNGRGQVTGLYPYQPGNVAVERMPSGRLRYKITNASGGTETLLQEEILHLRYRTRDGVMGLSPIQIAAATFGLALAQQDQAGAQVSNAFRPAGALVFPGNIGGKDVIIQKFRDRFVGSLKNNEVMILDGGAKFETFQIPNKDSEFLDSRKLSNLDVCRVYGVPPSVAGITDDATYSNIGEESRALVVRCLAPWAKRIEQAMNVALLTSESRKTYFIEHDLAGLLRGDLKTRYEAYKIGRDGGWLSPNEIRGWENLSEIDGGESYLEPLNMKQLGQPPQSATVH
jgi:HK97 family phage portal protein